MFSIIFGPPHCFWNLRSGRQATVVVWRVVWGGFFYFQRGLGLTYIYIQHGQTMQRKYPFPPLWAHKLRDSDMINHKELT